MTFGTFGGTNGKGKKRSGNVNEKRTGSYGKRGCQGKPESKQNSKRILEGNSGQRKRLKELESGQNSI